MDRRYDDRLNGHVREEERELAYVRIEEGLWNEGPAVANAEIKLRIEAETPRDLRRPAFAGALNVAASPVSATKTGFSGSRRPVFKGFFSYTHRDDEVDVLTVIGTRVSEHRGESRYRYRGFLEHRMGVRPPSGVGDAVNLIHRVAAEGI